MFPWMQLEAQVPPSACKCYRSSARPDAQHHGFQLMFVNERVAPVHCNVTKQCQCTQAITVIETAATVGMGENTAELENVAVVRFIR